jgi:hypothetical protein
VLRLATILCRDGLALPGIRINAMTIDVEKAFLSKGWRIWTRGPKVYFLSPDGTAYEDVRSKYMFGWKHDADDELKQTDNWSSAPYVPKPVEAPPPVAISASDDIDDDVPVDTVQRGKRR